MIVQSPGVRKKREGFKALGMYGGVSTVQRITNFQLNLSSC